MEQNFTIKNITKNSTNLEVDWSDGKKSKFNYLWLRDNCPTAHDKDSRHRMFNILKVSNNINPKKFSVNFFKNFNLKYFIFLSENKFQVNKKEDIFFLKKKYSGANSDEKIKKVINFLKLKYDEGFLFTSPENIGWLTNIRSKDKKYSKIKYFSKVL